MYKIFVDGSLFCSSEIEELAIINPEIDLEVNKAGTFTFTLPPTHPYYNTIQKRTSLIDVYRDDESEPLFEGVCIESTVDFYKQKKLVCEGELTFLNDSKLRPQKYQDKTVRQLLESYISQHNSLVESKKHFTVGQVTVSDSNNSIYCFTNYNSTMQEIKEDLVDDYGGYLRCRHVSGVRYLDYLASSPRTSNQVIRLGENLLDLSQNIDTEDIATVIIPLGQTLETQSIEGLDERLTIKTAAADSQHPAGADYVYSSNAVSSFGWIEQVVTWDDVTTVADLLAKGKAYLSDIQYENLVIQAKAIDLGLTSDELNKFRVLDLVRVVSVPHGLDRYFLLSKLQIHLNNPENDTITLGISESNSLTAKSQSANTEILERIEELPTSNMMQSAINNATALLTGAEGGYVVITRNAQGQPTEIKIQDALNNPTKIWRWNQNGFGYSSDGGQTYGTAITMDGSIVASYITSGTMVADRIRGGELLVGGSGLAANGQIIVKDSSNIKTIEITKDGLTIWDANGNGKVYLDHDGLLCIGGRISGAYIYSSCTIDTDKFRVDDQGNIFNWGETYSNGEGSFSRVVGRLGVVSYGDLYVQGSKNRILKVEKYGWLGFEAYETPQAYFGDIGENCTDSKGNCVIEIDPKFIASTTGDYHVFIQAYDKAELYVTRDKTSFKVSGTPNTKFSWEIKAVQLGKKERFKKIPDEVIEIMEGDKYGKYSRKSGENTK